MEEQSNNKDETLNSRLKEVYVTSHDKPEKSVSTEKPLPLQRKSVEQAEFGYQEPARVTRGKLSIRQALVLIGRHQQDPAKYDALALAKEFTIHPIVSGIGNNEFIKKLLIINPFFFRKHFKTL